MPPTATEVVRRLAALKVVCFYVLRAPSRAKLAELSRGWSESEKNDFAAKAAAERDVYWKRVMHAGKGFNLTPGENAIANTTVATMTAKQQADTAWRVEAVAVLLWALGGKDTLPGYDTPTEHEIVNVPAPADAALRAEGELQAARAVAELWHWRVRTREAAERGTPLALTPQMKGAGIKTYDDLVRTAAAGAHAKGHLPELVEGDFPVQGQAFRSLSPGAFAAVRAMAHQRRQALDWLTGRAPGNRWDDTPAEG